MGIASLIGRKHRVLRKQRQHKCHKPSLKLTHAGLPWTVGRGVFTYDLKTRRWEEDLHDASAGYGNVSFGGRFYTDYVPRK